jgi:hypothetical protein
LSPFFLAGPAGANDAPGPHPLEVFPISGLTYAKKQEITTTSRGLAAAPAVPPRAEFRARSRSTGVKR